MFPEDIGERFVRQDRFQEHLALHRLDCLASHGKLDAHEFVSRFIAETPPEEVRPPREPELLVARRRKLWPRALVRKRRKAVLPKFVYA